MVVILLNMNKIREALNRTYLPIHHWKFFTQIRYAMSHDLLPSWHIIDNSRVQTCMARTEMNATFPKIVRQCTYSAQSQYSIIPQQEWKIMFAWAAASPENSQPKPRYIVIFVKFEEHKLSWRDG